MNSSIDKSKKDLKEELNKEIIYGNTKEVKKILDYSTENKIILNLNEKDDIGSYPLLYETWCSNNIEIVQLLIDYATENKIILELNEKDKYGWYPLIRATDNNNTEMIKLLIDYATENKIILELNEKDKYEYYPLLYATYFDNIEIVQLLIDYANKNKIILNLNEKGRYGFTSIFLAIQNNNIEIIKMLVKYSIENEIKLRIDENDIEKMISEEYLLCKLNNISEINSKFIKLIYFYKNKNIIEVIFSENSYFLKKFNEFNENKGIENESRNYVILEIENEIMRIE